MKYIAIILFVLQISVLSYAQTITVTKCPSNNCLALVEPSTSLTYGVDTALGTGNTYINVDWSCQGAEPGSGGGNSVNTTITWENTPNTGNAHNVIAYLNYRDKDGNIKRLASPQRNVTVKHIGPITQLSLNSNAGNTIVSNNTTVQLACGQQALTLGIPTPTTDPSSAITYTWQFPWGTQTTSTPSVSTTSSVGQTDGTIIVDAKRNDGTTTRSFGFTIVRPRVGTPTIGGVPTGSVCVGNYFYLIGNATNATSHSWSTTGALSKTFAEDDFAEILATSSGSSGTITYTVDNACQSPKSATYTIYTGTPVITNATVNGQQLATPNYIYNPALLNITPNNEVGTSYDWQILQGSGNIYYNGYNQVSAYAYPFVRIQATVSNQCGAGDTRTFYLYDQSNGFYRMASPNPATNSIITDIILMQALKKVTLVSDARPGVVRMYNANGSLNADTHRHNNLLSFDVDNLPRGLYHLNFVFEGNRTFTENIVLN